MSGFFLLIPFLLIRFTLLSRLDKGAIKRAAHFPPMEGTEVVAYWIYQITNIVIFIYLWFLKVEFEYSWIFITGCVLYLLGLILCTISIVNFAAPETGGLNHNGIYRFSRNPMYLSYFLIFIGCTLLTQSLILCGVVLIFQISAHWIIRAEERWCIKSFGDSYRKYMNNVRRYI